MKTNPSINTLDTGFVYRNDKPHVVSRHAYFPTISLLPGGELVCGMDIGEAFESPQLRSYTCRSGDHGQTWSVPQKIFEPDTTAHAVSTTCRIGHVGNGELLGWTCLFARTHPEEGLANPQNGGFCHTDFATVRSVDAGQTWSPPQPVKLPVDWKPFETCSPPLVLDDDRLLTFSSPWATWEGQNSPWGHNGVAFTSEDRGQTWSNMITVFDGQANHLAGFEQAMATLSDGRVLAVAWTLDLKTQKSVNNRIALSNDSGRRFNTPVFIPIHGETCRLVALEDNHVLAVYRRVDQPGLWAQIAAIKGNTWHPVADRLLWGGTIIGREENTDNAIASMSDLRFGCPAITRLQNGDLYVVFWAVEDCVSSIRWIRLDVKA